MGGAAATDAEALAVDPFEVSTGRRRLPSTFTEDKPFRSVGILLRVKGCR